MKIASRIFIALSLTLGATTAFQVARQCTSLRATLAPTSDNAAQTDNDDDGQQKLYIGNDLCNKYKSDVLEYLSTTSTGVEFGEQLELSNIEASIYSIFDAIRAKVPLGLHGMPFVLRHDEVVKALERQSNTELEYWPDCFTMTHLKQALEDDFLDAARGSTDTNTGWQITDVSVPRGQSFEEARMTFQDVSNALEKGTVIFNAAGAHIPRLAGPSLAALEATQLPCALNLYVTNPRKKTSAPPHTDKQDVVVIQSTGSKHWKVFAPPKASSKPFSDMFTRGKLHDRLPLHVLEKECELLVETTLEPGDVLFVPAAFPHTTSTAAARNEDASIHLTLGIDHHIWQLDYLSVRRLALQRAGVTDTALGPLENDDAYIGKVNSLPKEVLSDLMAELPLGLLDEATGKDMIESVVDKTMQLSKAVDSATFEQVADDSIWRETVQRIREQGIKLLDTHRDMYLAAIEEGRARIEEEAMTAHLTTARTLTPERIQRMSVFRVKQYYDKVNDSIENLKKWANEGMLKKTELPTDWEWTLPVKVGDKVEADLGGAFFEATVSRASGGTYDVNFFDGDRETNLQRHQVKLLEAPSLETSIDTSNMTPKQLKRWKKQQEKMNK